MGVVTMTKKFSFLDKTGDTIIYRIRWHQP